MLCGQSEHLILFSSTDGENSHQVTKQFAHSHTGEERGVPNSSYVPFLFPLCIVSIIWGTSRFGLLYFAKGTRVKIWTSLISSWTPAQFPVMELFLYLYFGQI